MNHCTTLTVMATMLLLGSMTIEHAQCELFTALVHMEGLLNLEQELLHSLNAYINAEKLRLQKLEDFASKVQYAQSLAGDIPSAHLYNPVNAYQLVNRYSNGWMKLHHHLYEDNAKDLVANISLNNYRLPSEEDMSGAMTALRRLQDTYQVKSSDMANGILGKEESLSMSAEDCYLIGRQDYLNEDWIHARDWMLEALNKFDQGDTTGIDLTLVYDHLAFAEYSLGNFRKAYQYTKDLLQNEPTHERALSNLAFFEDVRSNRPDEFIDAEQAPPPTGTDRLEPSEKEAYEALCREGRPLPSEEHHKLICYYYDAGRNPRLIIRPAKVEVVYPDPKIYILRDIISVKEMSRLRELAAPILNRATVHDVHGNLIHANYRISKSGWLSPSDDPLGYVSRIDQRIEDVTGLSMSTAEQLQVVNYGIGGHYEPHYDFAQVHEDSFTSLGTGNRVATVLFYMSEVELGGATVFSQLGARIPPTYGDAAFWWNLKKSGEGDLRTRHAGCPVLVGSKWVCNKWIHERGQEFRRPCGLSPEE